MLIYTYDTQRVYSGEQEIANIYAPVPKNSTPVAPPKTSGTEVAQWTGTGWEVLPERPPAPEPPPEPVPQSCTRRQGRLALLGAGKLDAVESAIAAIADSTERMAAQIEYEADTWERDNAFLQAMWAQLGGTEQQLDDLFREAVTL